MGMGSPDLSNQNKDEDEYVHMCSVLILTHASFKLLKHF